MAMIGEIKPQKLLTSEGTANGAGKSESRVESQALGLLLGGGLRQNSGRCSHCDGDECARWRERGIGNHK